MGLQLSPTHADDDEFQDDMRVEVVRRAVDEVVAGAYTRPLFGST